MALRWSSGPESRFLLVDNLVDGFELGGDVGQDGVIVLFLRKPQKLRRIIEAGLQFLHGIETRAQRFRLAHRFVGFFLVGPEVGIVHARRKLGQARGEGGSVKDPP